MPGGRPKKFTKKFIDDLLKKFEKYIKDTDIPILKEFAYLNNIYSQRLYEFEEFTDSIKRCIEKKESKLEELALKGKINVTMAIFSLKQLGWRDKQELEHSTNIDIKEFAEVIKKNYTVK